MSPNLDGFYQITYVHTAVPDFFDFQGYIVVVDGLIQGLDTGRGRWRGHLMWVNDKEIEASAQIEMVDSLPKAFLMDSAGNPTKATQVYRARLRVIQHDANLHMEGELDVGTVKIEMVIRRLREINERG